MRTTVAILALALASVASAAVDTQRLATPAPVRTLAYDGPLLAYATGAATRDCDRVRIWNRATGRTVRLGRTTSCNQTSTGTGIAALSIAGNRVLWLHFTGGNIREWSLFTATTTAPRPRRLRFVARDVDGLPPIILGEGDLTARYGGVLPYAVDREVVGLAATGSRVFSWTAPTRVTALGANWGAVAIGLQDGRIAVYENGSVGALARLPSAASAVFVTGNGIAAQLPRDLYLVEGSEVHRRPLPADARVRDAEGYRAVYLTRGRARLIDMVSGRTRDLGPATDVQLEYETVAIATGRRIRLLRVS